MCFVFIKLSMACLDMYNKSNEHEGLDAPPPGPPLPMSPRISFSNDFVESSHSSHHQQMMRAYRDAPVSSDFEFSVSNYSMMSADELFFKGKLLPFKEESCCSNQVRKTTTLRDELQVQDDDDDDNFSLKPPKSSTRWKGLLGLKKSHIGSKKIDKTEGTVEKRSNVVHEDVHSSKNPQEPNSRDFEFRI